MTSKSWSEMKTYLHCPRKHELAYMENLELAVSVGNKNRYWGTVFHAGVAEFLRTGDTHKAIVNARAELIAMTVLNKTYTKDGQRIIDDAYYAMIEEIHHHIPELLLFYLPRLGIGTQYRVAVDTDIWGDGTAEGTPIIEYSFDHNGIKGIVDALLIDLETGEQVLADWKLRASFPFDEYAALDGQLPLYAAVLNEMGACITTICMWQMRRQTPKPARLLMSGLPSTAVQDTTWEYWLETLPPDLRRKLDLEDWADALKDKLKSEDEYVRRIYSTVSATSSMLALANAHSAIELIRQAEENHVLGATSPAILDVYGCKFCDFVKLCSTVLKYGGDAKQLISENYVPRREEVAIHGEED